MHGFFSFLLNISTKRIICICNAVYYAYDFRSDLCSTMLKKIAIHLKTVKVDMLLQHVADFFGTNTRMANFFVMTSSVAFYVTVAVLVPTVLRSKHQLHYLHMFGFFYTACVQQTDWISVQLVRLSVAGQFTLAGTESSLAVFSAYLCGLFDIARRK
ncbi:uncharacterized protein LOC144477950 [Augochlora pura]